MDKLCEQVIGAAIEVHRELGPGLLESSYEKCLTHELSLRGISGVRQKRQCIIYKGLEIEEAYRLDILVEGKIILELKVVDQLTDLHLAQMMTYLKHSGCTIGYLMNFNVKVFKDGLRRVVLDHHE